MKNVLIVKTGAAGDVLRTTFILQDLVQKYNVHWLTDPSCVNLINKSAAKIYTDVKELDGIFFETVYCLEEEVTLLESIETIIKYNRYVGYYHNAGKISYTDSNTEWFDMSLNSKHGIQEANRLKLENKKTFQELVAPIFDLEFTGQTYNNLHYNTKDAIISGDIALAKFAGNKWPNKNWAYYDELKAELEYLGYTVNYLPTRETIKEHIADIASHKLIVSGDSLPMHIATALGIPSIPLFTCTSPWEIYDYKLVKKVVSRELNSYYYSRDFNKACTTAITLEEVLKTVKSYLDSE
jgi:heptosyltransferase-2